MVKVVYLRVSEILMDHSGVLRAHLLSLQEGDERLDEAHDPAVLVPAPQHTAIHLRSDT